MQGIYLIQNTINGNRYVGGSANIGRRMVEHFSANSNSSLSDDIRMHGKDFFCVEILEEVNDPLLVASREAHWIKELNPEYNQTKGGSSSVIFTKEHRSKMKKIAKKSWENLPDEVKKKIISNLKRPAKGHPVSEETRKKLRDHRLGKKSSAETIEKMSQSQKVAMLGNQNGNKKVTAHYPGKESISFDSIVEAAKHFGIIPSMISAVLRGRRNKTAGYYWKYGV